MKTSVYIISYLTYSFTILTLIGSIFTFIVFSKKVFEKCSIGLYCKSLAIFDLFVFSNLIVGFIPMVINYDFPSYIDWVCKSYGYIIGIFTPMSGWVLVFFSLDQLITVSMTKRFAFFKKKLFQYSLIIGLFVFHCLFYIPGIFSFGVVNVTTSDHITESSCSTISIIMPIIFLFESTILPLIILIVLTYKVIRILVESRMKIINESTSNPSSMSRRRSSMRRAHDYKFAFNSVILNIMHIVLSLPLVLYYTIPSNSYEYDLADLLKSLAFFFFFFNFFLHFWVHFFVNSIFRKEFLILLRFREN